MIEQASKTMQDDQKTKAELLQELDGLRRRVSKPTQVEENLKRYQFMVESANDAIFFKDLKIRYVIANNKALEVLGLSREQVIGKNDYEIMPNKDEAQKNIEGDNLVFKTGKPTEVTKQMTDTDGKERWFQAIKVPQFDEEGKIIGLIGIARDVTEHKKAEGQLRQSEEKYRLLFEGIGTDNTVISVDGVYLMMNAKGAEHLGGGSGQFIGKSVYDTFPKDAADEYVRRFRDVAESGETKIYEDLVELPTGNRWFLTKMWPVKDSDGNRTAVQLISHDITDRKKTEEELRASEERFSDLAERSFDLIFRTDAQGYLTYVSRGREKILDYKPEEMVGTHFKNYLIKSEIPRVLQRFAENMEGRNLGIYQMEAMRKDRSSVFIELNSSPIVKDGETIGIQGIIRDITERKRAEEALRESEHQKRAILDSTPDLAWLKNKEGIYIAANEPLCKAFGVKLGDLVGKTDFDISPEDLAKKYRADDEKVMKSGKRNRVVEPWGKKKGKRIWIETIKTPIYNDRGEILGTSGIARDITERKKTEEELRESEEKYRRLFEETTDAIFVADAETGIITDCNHAAAELVGREKSELIGKHQRILHPPEETEGEFSRTFKQHIVEKEGQVLEAKVVTKQGEIKDVAIRAGLIELEGKKRIQAMFRDITESKQREKELNLYREKMARAEQLASVGTLSATLAHELTQPLTVVNLSIENALAKLETTPSAATVIKNIEDSLTEVSNITSIVNRFRNYARRSSKRIVSEVDLKAVAERTVQLLSASARQARVTLRLEGMDKLPHIYASEKDIEQLFFALVENAVHVADGKKDRLLIIGGDVKDERIELRFCDDCGGIAPENLDKIFEPFFTTRPAGEGTGLGLCIVQDVVSRARGKIRVESQAGQGTTFFVTLPINKDDQS